MKNIEKFWQYVKMLLSRIFCKRKTGYDMAQTSTGYDDIERNTHIA